MLNLILLILFTTFWASSDACAGIEIVSRAQWQARQPKWTVPIHRQVEHVFIAHTVTPECHNKEMCSARMRSMQNFHMDMKGWSDISYTFVIGGDGRVYEGVGWTRQGIHTYGWNSKSHGIAFIGNYMNVEPNSQMLNAARRLIICGIQQQPFNTSLFVRLNVCSSSVQAILALKYIE
ncbi:peptidoglycan-recognition protein 1-like isoform X3 [Stegodyphus dumicola]|uniref:peptidoglycan-recognition protein 1-like isoform X3 n=1 Tax=Stegodyphus dumicola TaxID=202533 RepID=UPI0015AC3500|nr:peptidoglycan-recognition protein 1-like isoform X3 [Stegodyphus dumicola]